MNNKTLAVIGSALIFVNLNAGTGEPILPSLAAAQEKTKASSGESTSKESNGQTSKTGRSEQRNTPAPRERPLPEEVFDVRFDPPMNEDEAGLFVPNTIYIDVRPDVNPKSVSVSTGPTGTGVADAWRGFAATDKSTTLPNGFKRFEITVTSCRRVGDAFQFTVITATKDTYSPYEGAFECGSKAARPIKMSFPQKGDVLQVGHTYTLRWEGGDPNFPVRIELGRLGWSVFIVLAESTPNSGSFVFTVPADKKVGELDPRWTNWGKNQYSIVIRQPDAGIQFGSQHISVVR